MRHATKIVLILIASLLSSGCVRTYTLFPQDGATTEGDASDDASTIDLATRPDGLPPPLSWGRYTATLDLPDCPAGRDLYVNDASATLDGDVTLDDPANAGATLSLIEAMWIAYNAPGQHNIYFDADVFPAAAPATITIPPDVGFPLNSTEVCVDGRDRGVIVRWQEGSSVSNVPRLSSGALFMGITLLAVPYEIEVYSSQLAACRINTDGYTTTAQPSGYARPWATGVGGDGTIGPFNVFAATLFATRTEGPGTIRGNAFGYDPLTRVRVGIGAAIDIRQPAVIEGNIFATDGKAIQPWSLGSSDVLLTIHDNFFGVDRDGSPIQGDHPGLELENSHGTIGPNNVIKNCAAAITIGDTTAFTITRNSISGNGAGIVFIEGPPTEAPTLTLASPTEVRGTCPVAGEVEAFSDAADQAERFIGTASCTAGGGFSITPTLPITAGRFVTATLTDAATQLTSAFSAPATVE